MVARYQAGPFGLLLQRHRTAAGLSQEELAERAGLSRRGLSDLERGARRTPYPATVRRLAEALGLSEADRAALLMAAHTRPGSTVVSDPQPRAGPLPALADALDLTGVDRAPLEDVVTERANDRATAGEPLVGREKEFGRILAIMDTVTVGPGRLVFVTGEPGIGKTRLAREVLSHARRAGAQGLVGRCFQQQMTVPFFPFTEALTTALGDGPRD
jgi:transcriptional regulator with XRE-family HTH domain